MTQTVRNYTRVLWELQIPVGEVKEAAQIYADEPTLQKVLRHPEIPVERKTAVIRRIFSSTVQAFLAVLCRHGRIDSLPGIADAYERYADSHRRILDAQILCVTPPDEAQTERLAAFLRKTFGVDGVKTEVISDPSLIGGFILRADGREYDWSIRGRLREMEQNSCR